MMDFLTSRGKRSPTSVKGALADTTQSGVA